jgi:hypothetical protein
VIKVIATLLLGVVLLGSSALSPGNRLEKVRAYTRKIEFNYVAWILNAIEIKLSQASLSASGYISQDSRRQLTLEYIHLEAQIQSAEHQLSEIYTDPNIQDPESASQSLRSQLDELYARRARLGPFAESVLQRQVVSVVESLGLTLGGQPIPPILFHSTPPPLALIISPRDVIKQEYDISLQPNLTLDQRDHLENEVDRALNVSSLTVGIGGVGVYPTMVMETSDLNWLTETIAHEWVHNYLTLRPLGVSYLNSPELRTMNETTASIAGMEIGQALMEKYYPELVPPPPPEQESTPQAPSETQKPEEFDFRAEMRITRVKVDQLLAQEQVKEAEAYMEQRRIVFWNHGYHIRKLNQAYFAFYGAYAAEPGGAAGEDPVGTAVRTLRTQSRSLADFLNRISWMSSYDQLRNAVGQS